MVFQKILLAGSWCSFTDRPNRDSRKNGYDQIIDTENKKKADKVNLKLTVK